jgi:hypothetical protein
MIYNLKLKDIQELFSHFPKIKCAFPQILACHVVSTILCVIPAYFSLAICLHPMGRVFLVGYWLFFVLSEIEGALGACALGTCALGMMERLNR